MWLFKLIMIFLLCIYIFQFQIHNYVGDSIVVVSTMTKDTPPHCKPHPHSLVGTHCEKGVCTVRLKQNNEAS